MNLSFPVRHLLAPLSHAPTQKLSFEEDPAVLLGEQPDLAAGTVTVEKYVEPHFFLARCRGFFGSGW